MINNRLLQECERGWHASGASEEREQHCPARVVQGIEHGPGRPPERRVLPGSVRAALELPAAPRGQPGGHERQHGHALRCVARQLRRRIHIDRLQGLRRQQVEQCRLHARNARCPRPGAQLHPRVRGQETVPDRRRQRTGEIGTIIILFVTINVYLPFPSLFFDRALFHMRIDRIDYGIRFEIGWEF